MNSHTIGTFQIRFDNIGAVQEVPIPDDADPIGVFARNGCLWVEVLMPWAGQIKYKTTRFYVWPQGVNAQLALPERTMECDWEFIRLGVVRDDQDYTYNVAYLKE